MLQSLYISIYVTLIHAEDCRKSEEQHCVTQLGMFWNVFLAKLWKGMAKSNATES